MMIFGRFTMLPSHTDTFLPVLEFFATVDTATRKDAK